jgi:hypothetical protein
MNWKEFFADNKSVTTDSGDEMRVEDLYQAFKARLIAEIEVDVPHESHYGRLVSRGEDSSNG